jgi:Transmembrane amino acid transporter protein
VLLGLFGYFFAYAATQDDILLNFSPDDSVIVWGRLGLGVTMLIAIPMLVLPCRYVKNEVTRDEYTLYIASDIRSLPLWLVAVQLYQFLQY